MSNHLGLASPPLAWGRECELFTAIKFFWTSDAMLRMTRKVPSDNLSVLLKRYSDVSRLDLSRRMNVAAGALGRIKAVTGNSQLDSNLPIAEFFRLESWQLLIENGHQLPGDFDPFKAPRPVAPSACQSGQLEDYPHGMVLGHSDGAEEGALSRLENVRAMPVNGDSMSFTNNEGGLVFVDTSCHHFEAEGTSAQGFDRALLLKRLSADYANHKTQMVTQDDITIFGRVKERLSTGGA
jgi:hypothetical protein